MIFFLPVTSLKGLHGWCACVSVLQETCGLSTSFIEVTCQHIVFEENPERVHFQLFICRNSAKAKAKPFTSAITSSFLTVYKRIKSTLRRAQRSGATSSADVATTWLSVCTKVCNVSSVTAWMVPISKKVYFIYLRQQMKFQVNVIISTQFQQMFQSVCLT